MNTEEQKKRLAELLRPLSPEEYAAAPVPTCEQIREVLSKGAEELRQARGFKPNGRW
jgi:hypothetical protein